MPSMANAVPIAVPVTKLAAAPKRKEPSKPWETESKESSLREEDDDDAAEAAPKPKAKPKPRSKAPIASMTGNDSDSDSGGGMSLMARLAMKTKPNAAGAAMLERLGGPSPAARPAVKRQCDKASPMSFADSVRHAARNPRAECNQKVV